ncbi:MAG: dihydrofolate reductase [Bacteroidetes bacterium]|nr:dihydrofolate reductase [Bacteroidota bacterium]
MLISLIVAASENNVIGKNNQLVWRLPNDMKFFKNSTWAMPVIMGRKTYESMNGEPLPGRFNIVITHQKDWKPADSQTQIAGSLQQAIELAKQTDCKEAFIIGGGQIYAEAIQHADQIYMTRVHTKIDGDTFFPNINSKDWKLVSNHDFPADDKHAYAYSFQLWRSLHRMNHAG